MLRCGLATLGRIIALSVSSKTKIPGVEVTVPIETLASVCSVNPSCNVVSATPLVLMVRSFQTLFAYTLTFLSPASKIIVPLTALATLAAAVTQGRTIPLYSEPNSIEEDADSSVVFPTAI